MGISNIKIKNFTVFDDIDIDFSSKMNVIIGDNGTGKTHLIKLMNMLVRPEFQKESNIIHDYFKNIAKKDFLKCYNNEHSFAFIQLEYNNSFIEYTLCDTSTNYKINLENAIELNNVFIPAKELLTHSKGFLSIYDERYIPFDKAYKDLFSKSLLPLLRNIPELGVNILPKLENIIGGTVIVENEIFYILKNNGSQVVFDLESEGIKKFALLWQLIMNGSIKNGSVLFWDEPESNINPKLIGELAEILLELSQNGVQVFVTSHEYMFAKYMEVLAKDDDITFLALYKNENDCIEFETEKKLSLIYNNSMTKENVILYKKEIERAMG